MEPKTLKPNPASTPPRGGKWTLWGGRLLSAVPVPLMLYGASVKLMHAQPVLEGFRKLGLPEGTMRPVGILEITCVLLYVIPRTAVFGAILVSGYMGGAILTHLRVGQPFVTPILVGLFAWAGLFLREPRLRALVPLRS